MPDDANVPAGFAPLTDAGAFVEQVGPLYAREHDGVIGVRVEARHLNLAGAAMGGFLATLVDVAFGRAIRAEADGESVVGVAKVAEGGESEAE
jgi:acyl-coenzyme A thioesterase PaaI-like protein